MDSYSTLLHQILNNSVLLSAVDQLITTYPDALNLISPDWENRLQNNKMYQEFNRTAKEMYRPVSGGEFYNMQFMKNKTGFEVLVAAECRFPKNYSKKEKKMYITTIDAKPLEKIARAMTSDLGFDINLSNELKFQFMMCSQLNCAICKDNSIIFSEKGYKISKIFQPCIIDTKVFDGKNIVNRFASHIENMFTQKFIAILSIKIDGRYDYIEESKTKCHRICGKIQEMIAMQESKLLAPKSVHLGNLQFVEGLEPLMEEFSDTQETEKRNIREEEEEEEEENLNIRFAIPKGMPEKLCVNDIRVEETDFFM